MYNPLDKAGGREHNFFNAMATQRFRRNTISMLKNSDRIEVTNHHDMASMLWTCYKDRMGQSQVIQMQFDLSHLIPRVGGLDELTVPFTMKEMDDVVAAMPSDKAPSPDGFNGMFVKRCWSIIKTEFYRLAEDFHAGMLKLENINGSYITLVPKVPVPVEVNDFRPISLTNV